MLPLQQGVVLALAARCWPGLSESCLQVPQAQSASVCWDTRQTENGDHVQQHPGGLALTVCQARFAAEQRMGARLLFSLPCTDRERCRFRLG